MTEYDQHLSAYHRGTVQVWCSKSDCELHYDGIEVDTETENGQTTCRPEDCPVCHSSWFYDKPVERDEPGLVVIIADPTGDGYGFCTLSDGDFGAPSLDEAVTLATSLGYEVEVEDE